MKVWKVIIGAVFVPTFLMGGCAVRATLQDRAAKEFCESLIPRLEEERKQTGSYPTRANPAWWAGQSVPNLIRTQRFYFVRPDGFGFYFKNDSWVFDNSWEFGSPGRDMKGWFSYDSNFGDY